MDNGFLKLSEDTSRRSSVFRGPSASLKGLPYATRVSCGGCCGGCRVKVEKDEGSLRIGRLSVAPNCHLILLVFGFCFLLAGAVLTALAYQPPRTDLPPQVESRDEEREEERVAGPLFVIIGSALVLLGVALALLGYRLTREARRQRAALSRFPESPSMRSPDFFNSDYFSTFPPEEGDSAASTRRGSVFFGSSFTRRSTLATIAQAVPTGFFIADSPRTPSSPRPPHAPPTDPHGFQEIELSSPKRKGRRLERQGSSYCNDEEFTLPALTLRPSLPIPMFGLPPGIRLDPRGLVVTSRSDEPFGSIASLSTGTGDIACFPSVHYAPPPTLTLPEGDDEAADPSPTPRELPPINVHVTMGNALTTKGAHVQRPLRCSKSEERSEGTPGDEAPPPHHPPPLERRGSTGA